MVNWSCLAGNDRRLEVTMTVTADDLDSVISCVVSGLLPITDRDWSVRAGTLEWDCWHTAEHIGDCLMSFAWQLAVQPSGRYVRAVATAEKGASPAEVLEFAVTGGRVLASMVRTSRAHVRAYHPAGMADPEGFAGMGCHEALLHGNDIAQAFGLSLDPPRDVASPGWAATRPCCTATTSPRPSASASTRRATSAAACWPVSSRGRPPTWPNPTRGPRCSGPAAGSNSPVTPGSPAGARTPPP